MPVTVDLNCDLGEGESAAARETDAALLATVTSANVACAFHAGNPSIMREVCERAVTNGVTVGAHVSYHDREGFGRRRLDVAARELTDQIVYQIAALDGIARAAGTRVRYVKPHGALYNRIVDDAEQASAVVEGVRSYDAAMPVLGLPQSQFLRLASRAGLPGVPEGFTDRAYTPEGRLVPRNRAGAVIDDPAAVVERSVSMAVNGRIHDIEGAQIDIRVRSLCVHSDTPGSAELARCTRAALVEAGAQISAFA